VILASVYWMLGFLRMGTSGLVAQARGAGDAPDGGAILIRALMIAAGAGLGLIAPQGGLVWAAFRIAPASAEVEGLARQSMMMIGGTIAAQSCVAQVSA
jgi:MATE family multidrug resistance protein